MFDKGKSTPSRITLPYTRAASSFVKVEIARLWRGTSEREPVEFDGWVVGDVPPEHILEIRILENVPARSDSNQGVFSMLWQGTVKALGNHPCND